MIIFAQQKGSTLRQRIDSIFDEYNFVPKTMFETNSIQTMRAMVAMGIGITFLGSSCREFMGESDIIPLNRKQRVTLFTWKGRIGILTILKNI